MVDGVLGRLLAALVRGEVGDYLQHVLAPQGSAPLRHLLEVVLVAARQRQPRAAPRQQLRDGLADARARAGHQHHLIREVHRSH